jgi:hypothetical protein
MKSLYLLLLVSAAALAGSQPAARKAPIQRLDIWGTCFFQFNCQGSPIGLGKTAAECRAQGGHSLFTPNVNRCYNL